MSNIYWIKVNHYSEVNNEDIDENGVTTADSFYEVLDFITSYYGNTINKITIELIAFDSGPIIVIPEDKEYIKDIIEDANQY